MRRALALILAVGAIVGARVAAPAGAPLIPLVAIEQGVSAQLVSGVGVFVLREGSQVTAFSPLTPGAGADRVVYCPREKIFVSPLRKVLFNAAGEHVTGNAPRDLDRFRVTVTNDLEVRIDVDAPVRARKSRGSVPGEIGNRYYDWAANPAKPAAFCQNPIRA